MLNYPIIFLGLYLAITKFSTDFDKRHFDHPFDLSQYTFVPKPVKKPTVDSSLLFPKSIKKTNASFNEISYQGKFQIKYLVVSESDKISLIPSIKQANSFENIVNTMQEDGYFLMNAGMFHPNFNAVGLTIADGHLKQALDTLNTPQNGNFYLYPNGVFTIDKKNKPAILTTQDFIKSSIKTQDLSLATQSGPMLVINNQIHPAFSAGSKNTNIRNGVGVNEKGEIIFAISETEITFYEFAKFFQEELHCSNALYLDGTISEVYYRDKQKLSHTPRIGNGKFGPLFMVKFPSP
jgi:uncharacterized protein YigE (DUF2233 family)